MIISSSRAASRGTALSLPEEGPRASSRPSWGREPPPYHIASSATRSGPGRAGATPSRRARAGGARQLCVLAPHAVELVEGRARGGEGLRPERVVDEGAVGERVRVD